MADEPITFEAVKERAAAFNVRVPAEQHLEVEGRGGGLVTIKQRGAVLSSWVSTREAWFFIQGMICVGHNHALAAVVP